MVIHTVPRISVCMIVRDESSVLMRCLDSIAGVYDELCVVDTGSKDGTQDIAKQYGARLRTFTLCNGSDGKIADFAAARNIALEMASCDWVLQIDADEVLEQGAKRIKNIIGDGRYDYIGFRICSEGAEWISGRLFRLVVGLKYRSRIHEYLDYSGRFRVEQKIIIRNIPNKAGKESSSERNIRLCLLVAEENPNEARIFHYLGNEYRNLRRFDDAITAYKHALTLGNFRVGLFHTAYYLAVCYLLKQNWGAAIDTAFLALSIDPHYAESYCLLGDIYSCINNVEFACKWYRLALTCKRPPEDALLGVQMWAYGEYPKQRLASLAS